MAFLSLVAGARLVLTDSGGIQEETTILDVPCLTMRPNTERPITVSHGTNRLVTPSDVEAAAARSSPARRPTGPRPPLWDGHAGERIADHVVEWLAGRAAAVHRGPRRMRLATTSGRGRSSSRPPRSSRTCASVTTRSSSTPGSTGTRAWPACSSASSACAAGPIPRIGGGTAAEQTGRMLVALEGALREVEPDAVVVYGDTNSTLAADSWPRKLGVPIAHVEAGLRSFDRRMPEEVNRVVTDHLARWTFAPTKGAVATSPRRACATASTSSAT